MSRRDHSAARRMSEPRGGSKTGSSRPPPLLGLGNFSAANFLQTAAGGGEAGVGSGFGWLTAFRLRSVPPAGNSTLLNRIATSGYQTLLSPGLTYVQFNGNGSAAAVSGAPLLASDVGRIHVLLARITAVPGGILEVLIDGAWHSVTPATPAGYTPNTLPTTIGQDGAGGAALSCADELGHLTFRGVPTRAQCEALIAAIRARGDVPDTMDGATITHRWSLRDELRGTVVVDGQTAPAQLTDTVTRAPVDALARQGSPVVRVIDPAIDGRRTLGAQGFSAVNALAGASGLVGAVSGHWGAFVIRQSALSTAYEVVAGHGVTNSNGWYLLNDNFGKLTVAFGGVGSTDKYTPVAADIGVMRLCLYSYVSTSICRFYYGSAVQVGNEQATGVYYPSTSQLIIGRDPAGSMPGKSYQCFGLVGGNKAGGLTPAQVQQAFAEFDATGRTPTMLGIAQHRYDLTEDILASGVDAVPAVVLDRVGTDHLKRVQTTDVYPTAHGLRGIGPYSALDWWQTAPGGGIRGSAAGFHVVIDVWLTKVPTASEGWAGCHSLTFTGGWSMLFYTGQIMFAMLGVGNSAGYTITSADLNKRLRFVGIKTPTVVQLWLNGAQIGADVASGINVVAADMRMGIGAQVMAPPQGPLTSGYVEGLAGGNTVPSAGNIATYFADLTKPIPTIAGVTLKRWTFDQDIAALTLPGEVPSKSVERVSGNDDLSRSGSGLVLAQRTERLWSYETSPIANGFLMPAAASDAFEAANVQIGNTTGSWWLTAITQQLGTVAGSKRFIHKSTGAAGFLGFTLNGANYQLQGANGAVMTTGAVAVISASDIGKIAVLTLMWDATQQKLRVFYKRAEIGGGTAFASGYTPDTGNLCWGAIRAGGGSAQDNASQLGMCGGNFLLSVPELQAQHDAILAFDGVIQAVPGKTTHLWNGRRLAGVSSFVPGVTTIPDELGGSPMVLSNVVGSAAIARADIFARAFVI